MIKTEASIGLLLLVGLLPIFNFFIIVLVLLFLHDWLGLLSFIQDCFIHLLRIQLTHFGANSLQGVHRKGWWMYFAPKIVVILKPLGLKPLDLPPTLLLLLTSDSTIGDCILPFLCFFFLGGDACCSSSRIKASSGMSEQLIESILP